MGGAMAGTLDGARDNNELVDRLKGAGYIVKSNVARAFIAVDRGNYFPKEYRDQVYKDCALKEEPLHLSAPCIYAKVVEALDLQSGLRFLNLGSGTGYLSTVVGLLLGSHGVNHGVELKAKAVAYAYMKLQEFKQNSPVFDEFDFCEPVMLVGNCLQLAGSSLYGSVYCGAACPDEHLSYVKNLLDVGGIVVVPVGDKLLRIQRTGVAAWHSTSIMSVCFSTLVAPEEGDKDRAAAVAAALLHLSVKCHKNSPEKPKNTLKRQFLKASDWLIEELDECDADRIVDKLHARDLAGDTYEKYQTLSSRYEKVRYLFNVIVKHQSEDTAKAVLEVLDDMPRRKYLADYVRKKAED